MSKTSVISTRRLCPLEQNLLRRSTKSRKRTHFWRPALTDSPQMWNLTDGLTQSTLSPPSPPRRSATWTSSSSPLWRRSREHPCQNTYRSPTWPHSTCSSMPRCRRTMRTVSTWMWLRTPTSGSPTSSLSTHPLRFGTIKGSLMWLPRPPLRSPPSVLTKRSVPPRASVKHVMDVQLELPEFSRRSRYTWTSSTQTHSRSIVRRCSTNYMRPILPSRTSEERQSPK